MAPSGQLFLPGEAKALVEKLAGDLARAEAA
jgi:hypothetical protein